MNSKRHLIKPSQLYRYLPNQLSRAVAKSETYSAKTLHLTDEGTYQVYEKVAGRSGTKSVTLEETPGYERLDINTGTTSVGGESNYEPVNINESHLYERPT